MPPWNWAFDQSHFLVHENVTLGLDYYLTEDIRKQADNLDREEDLLQVDLELAFGLRMPERNRQTLRQLLTGQKWQHVQWYQAVKSKTKYGLEFNRI